MYNLRGHQCNGASRRFNGHYQGRGKGIALLNGFFEQTAQALQCTFGFLCEVGQPLKLRYMGYTTNLKSQFMKSRWTNETYIPLMIIPHAILKFTDHGVIDIGNLANLTYTCSEPVIVENSTFTVTMQSGSTWTFDALVVKILKTDMLSTSTRYYMNTFDVVFPSVTAAIEVGDHKPYRYRTTQCKVGDLVQDQQGYWDFNSRYIEDCEAYTDCNITDYQNVAYGGTFRLGFFGDEMTAIMPLSPYAFISTKTLNGAKLVPSMLFQSQARGESDGHVRASYMDVSNVFSYATKFENSDYEITGSKQFMDYFKMGILQTTDTVTALYNTWDWSN